MLKKELLSAQLVQEQMYMNVLLINLNKIELHGLTQIQIVPLNGMLTLMLTRKEIKNQEMLSLLLKKRLDKPKMPNITVKR